MYLYVYLHQSEDNLIDFSLYEKTTKITKNVIPTAHRVWRGSPISEQIALHNVTVEFHWSFSTGYFEYAKAIENV